MKKIIIVVILFLVSVYIMADDNRNVDNLIKYFSSKFTVTDKSDVYYQMLLATDGKRFWNRNIYIY
jgi:hypothetical protein